MKKFDVINADIAENISLSKSAAYAEGRKIIVDGGYAGQNADLKITKIKNARTEAVIERVLKKAPGQIEAPCAAFGKCGGCRFQDIPYAGQLRLKEGYIRSLFEKAAIHYGLMEPVIASPTVYGYKIKWNSPSATKPQAAR